MPPQLTPEITRGPEGRPEIRLTYKFNQWDQRPKYLRLKYLRPLPGYDEERIPAYYGFDPGNLLGESPLPDSPLPAFLSFDPNRVVRPPLITIIAGPGVSVETRNWPDSWTASLEVPRLDVYRVQNPRLVPNVGADATVSGLTSDYFVDTFPPPAWRSGNPIFDSSVADEEERSLYFLYRMFQDAGLDDHIVVTEFEPMRLLEEGRNPFVTRLAFLQPPSLLQVALQPNGVIFTHPYSSQMLSIEVPQLHRFLQGESGRDDHEARFAFRINNGHSNHRRGILPLVTIVKSPTVRATLSCNQRGFIHGTTSLQERRRRSLVFFEVFNTDFENVPPQGADLPTRRLSRARIDYIADPILAILQTITDLAVGAVPYVGDAADISEFFYACATDRDRWGYRVSTLEKVVMGLGALLPLVGSGVLRAGPRLARTFGRTRRAAQRLANVIDNAGFSESERRFIIEVADQLRRRRHGLSDDQWMALAELLQRMPTTCSV
ncbi:hypothetical protein EZI54_11370 [Marinobacter halodurans]|uniref:Uncharacterized protein n=1 Tax=Marinobacter halodurans TaxID=2528979 RepID=A0ABY1ZM19_9GAMM|nr:hypothetical protein [Marinobacter halodurans]TBW55761.1 hypothetical protein EZI54_11370 [Marinobacter halodurans]